MLFAVPVGGGIPAGVLLAQSRGIGWLTMSGIYLVSDILLAFLFEPLMMLFLVISKRSEFLTRLREHFKRSMAWAAAGYGAQPGPLSLIIISFGVDPMTGRAAAMAAGHHFITGWAIAIAGDMLYFAVLMVSTIWLNDILGDGTWTAIIIMALMLGVPVLLKRFKKSPVP
ncbi:MAG: hypothetical protein EOO81_12180 [Oxalobacteraceae bacterium]|nr:MAG: hypothetical protein EOO81_12180 [Oxalobacteraceae bacterium]